MIRLVSTLVYKQPFDAKVVPEMFFFGSCRALSCGVHNGYPGSLILMINWKFIGEPSENSSSPYLPPISVFNRKDIHA